ncbi:nuclear transport factor 2 family protein [Novosphingobium sp. G106]|uniref:nuclear transport factor 2 family protein n=1 Tax=Novosphingobium sp. G106 TaxID=2849500 RepID=UPI001C2CCBE9|nr:nuclear transport factor 2 family protein [Novosphingobium sp. G106]MBV1688960.1 nuclear transport factor 2 family protein [Novosphingobium sp. G106]
MKWLIVALILALSPASSAFAADAGPACEVAAQYVQIIQQGKYQEVGNLFAGDAVFYNPQGRILRGRAPIKAFYSAFLGASTPTVRAARFTEDRTHRVCVMELETRMHQDDKGRWSNSADGNYTLSAIDRMMVNADGKIAHMIVYLAPATRWQDRP